MNYLRFLRVGVIALTAVALVFVMPFEADAQSTTGKISGRVLDAATGEALPGANVVLEGTSRGATTNVNGEYFIIRVTPGRYTVASSMVGYRTIHKTDVIVQLDLTATVDFELTESSEQLEDLIVTADRPPVQMDIAFAQTTLSAEEIRSAPVGSRMRDAFTTQVGLDEDSWGLSIRGSTEEEIVYNLDGVGQRDSRNSRPSSSFSTTATQEVQVLTGGFNAEYDNVRSGVVNVITKEPRQWTVAGDARISPAATKNFGPAIYSVENWWDVGRYQSFETTADRDVDGKADFAGWNNLFVTNGGAAGNWNAGIFNDPIQSPAQAKAIWDYQHRAIGDNEQQNLNAKDRDSDYTFDATVGGPLVQDKISFLLSNRRERTAYTWGMAVPNYRDNTIQARAIFTPTATTKLNLGFIRQWGQGGKYGNFLGTYARGPEFEASNHRDRNIYAMGSGSNIETINRRHGSLTWTHTLSPKTFYNITGRVGKVNFQSSWQPNQAAGVASAAIDASGNVTSFTGDITVDSDGRMRQNNLSRNLQASGVTSPITDAEVSSLRASGAIILDEAPLGFMYKPGQRDLLGKYQMRGGSGNPARSGDWTYMYEDDWSIDMTSQVTPNHQIKAGFQLHHFWLRELRGFASSIQDDSRREFNFEPDPGFDDPATMGVTDTADFHNYWVKTPLYGGAYIQDRMEYRQIVINAGMRLDYHRPDMYFDIPNEMHADWMGSNAVLLYERARTTRPPTKWNFSPRIGVSHPITVESKLFFNYGRFVQPPTSDQLYETQSGLGEPLEQFGNPWLESPVTTAYEVGYERNINNYLVTGTLYFKDIEKEIWARPRWYVNNTIGRSTRARENGQAKDQRGFELSLRKARGKFLTGFASYDFRVDRTRITGWARIYDAKTVSNASYLRIEESASGANPLFKARPILKFGLNFRTPLDYGGESSMLKGGWEANAYFRNEAGQWFNYNPNNDAALRNVDNAQWKDERTLDFRLSKTFDFSGAPMVYFEVQNLLDSRVSNTNRTRPWDHLGEVSRGQEFEDYMTSLGWSVDTSGNLSSGDKPGKDLGPQFNPRRDYLFWFGKRDIHFGLRFNY
jgi:outer membrane receptor protein involved in Fe transport